ncbi:RsmE family RNA methyltransferase [Sulfobacillus thermosulfidooxidans]|uniref:RsmE family RNA methyltransferase n=1 Tax=Sulfobacillus thermosulfidooxidans TaxID=28034 RepID=UPI0006B4B320|nr:RsmE family RNA methyltransferase [Sulfobacillus thermosulfidooxidans]
MIRIVVTSEQIAPDNRIVLTAEQSHYLVHVMRVRPGEKIEALVSGQAIFECAMTQDSQVLECFSAREVSEDVSLYLAQSMIKKDLFSDIIEKGTEAGIAGFYPLLTERTIVREISPSKWNRWHKVAKEATEQAHRSRVPEIFPLTTLAEMRDLNVAHKLVLDVQGKNLWDWLMEHSMSPLSACLLVVGPEGGLTPQERDGLINNGFDAVSLGPYVYRAENAGVFAAALLRAWMSSHYFAQGQT